MQTICEICEPAYDNFGTARVIEAKAVEELTVQRLLTGLRAGRVLRPSLISRFAGKDGFCGTGLSGVDGVVCGDLGASCGDSMANLT